MVCNSCPAPGLLCSSVYLHLFFPGHRCINIAEKTKAGWQRNRTGRPLSPPRIHQKNISMLSKFYKTTSECWQRTSGTQKSRSLSSKTGRKNIKYVKRDKGGRAGALTQEGSPVPEGSLTKKEVSKHQETLSLLNLWRALETQRAT